MTISKPRLSHLLVVLSLLPACSRAVTCATEGCSNASAVSLNTPLPLPVGSTSDAADATPASELEKIAAAQKALDEKLGKITDRVSLSEALGVLHSQTLELHEQRLKSLEDGSKLQQDNLNAIGIKVNQNQAAIASVNIDLQTKYAALSKDLADQAKKEADDIAALKNEVKGVADDMIKATATLADADKEQFAKIVDLMAVERARVDGVDMTIREEAAQNMLDLQSDLDAAVKKLSAADQENLKLVTDKMKKLDGKITDVAVVGSFVAARLAAEIEALQKDVCNLDKADKENYDRLKGKIADLTKEMNAKTSALSTAQTEAIARIDLLEKDQATLSTNLTKLDKRVEFYRNAQTFVDGVFANQILALDSKINKVRDGLQTQIDKINVNVTNISQTVSGLSTSLAYMKEDVKVLQTKVADYGTRITSAETDVDALQLELAAMQSTYSTRYDEIIASIEGLDTLIDAKEECTLGAETRVLLVKYRSFTCDGKTIKVVVL